MRPRYIETLPKRRLPVHLARLKQKRPRESRPAHLGAVVRPEPAANPGTPIVTNLAAHIRDALPRRFSELAVFDARLYIRVRRIDEPA